LVRTAADEGRYIESFWKSEGIRLDREAIKPNAAKLGLAKLSQLYVGQTDREV